MADRSEIDSCKDIPLARITVNGPRGIYDTNRAHGIFNYFLFTALAAQNQSLWVLAGRFVSTHFPSIISTHFTFRFCCDGRQQFSWIFQCVKSAPMISPKRIEIIFGEKIFIECGIYVYNGSWLVQIIIIKIVPERVSALPRYSPKISFLFDRPHLRCCCCCCRRHQYRHRAHSILLNLCRPNVCVSVLVFAYTASAVIVESSRREIRLKKNNIVFQLSPIITGNYRALVMPCDFSN